MSNNNGSTGERKTILFNTSTLQTTGFNKTKKRKEKKVKPVVPLKPNALKKKLLEKIKQHQIEERIKNNPSRANKHDSKSHNTLNQDNHDNDFHGNFSNSLEYLNNINKQRKKERSERKKQKTLKRPIMENDTVIAPNLVTPTGTLEMVQIE